MKFRRPHLEKNVIPGYFRWAGEPVKKIRFEGITNGTIAEFYGNDLTEALIRIHCPDKTIVDVLHEFKLSMDNLPMECYSMEMIPSLQLKEEDNEEHKEDS